MKSINWIRSCPIFLLICLYLLSACGKDDVYQPEAAIDGYVYVARKIQAMDNLMGAMLVGDIKAEGDYLYYARIGEKGTEICRIPLSSINTGDEAPKFLKEESVLTFKSARTAVPDYIAEQLPAKLLADSDNSKQSMFIETDNGEMMDISQLHCFFSFMNFNVDTEGNIYCWQEVSAGKDFDLEPIGGTLSKWSCEGEKVYQVYFPDMQVFALFGDENACILGEGRILLLDGKGISTGELSTEQYRGSETPIGERLFGDGEGHVYYTLQNYNRIKWGFEVLEDEGLKLKEIKGNFYEAVGGGIYTSLEGKMLPISHYSDILREYDAENDSIKEVLNWMNSGFLSQYIQSIVTIAPGKLLVYYNDYSSMQGIYLLSLTAMEELPEKETIIIFSYDPTETLRNAVLQFNKENDAYQIIIDSYGAEFSWLTMEGDATLVDLAVVSQTPPDMLDMTFWDPRKYAAKGVLEDLSPYLDESSILNREDFLENALEGMTLGGCLTCIPHSFSIDLIQGRKSQVGLPERWDMDEAYSLSDAFPESVRQLVGDTTGNAEKREYLLNTFCSYYIEEKFVDWEKGEVYFDNPEFIRLLKWIDEYAEDNSAAASIDNHYISKDILLFHDSWNSFLDMACMAIRCGDETVLLGFPSADGEGTYPVSVMDALAITANSTHKDGAWEFIEYYLSTFEPRLGFSPKKEWLRQAAEKATCQDYNLAGNIMEKGYVYVEDEMIPYYAISQEQADLQLAVLESADFTLRSEKEKMILRIISEEAESYYNGDKSIEEVIQIIQNRAGLILQEG